MRSSLLAMLAVLLSAGSAAAQACPPLPGVERIVGPGSTRFVIFGETHGTAETPELFGDAICHAAAAGPVIVAIEADPQSQQVLEDYMASDGRLFARRRLLSIDPFLAGLDGRGSEAMLALLERLRLLKAAGANVSARASNGSLPLPDQAYHELSMADAWARAAASNLQARVFALVGSLHALKARRESMRYNPAASHLPAAEVTSLLVVGGTGTAWNMQRDQCGANPYQTGEITPRSIRLVSGEAQFDGRAYVGRAMTASAPANGRQDCADYFAQFGPNG